jgi:hypothetical protein
MGSGAEPGGDAETDHRRRRRRRRLFLSFSRVNVVGEAIKTAGVKCSATEINARGREGENNTKQVGQDLYRLRGSSLQVSHEGRMICGKMEGTRQRVAGAATSTVQTKPKRATAVQPGKVGTQQHSLVDCSRGRIGACRGRTEGIGSCPWGVSQTCW